MVRLYVGGLPQDVTKEQLAQRFAPFGRVDDADLVLGRADGSAETACRGFGYVELEPTNDGALHRCLSTVSKPLVLSCSTSLLQCVGSLIELHVLQYNGCKWRGGTLRVEQAKPAYHLRLVREWAAEAQRQQEESACAAVAQEKAAQALAAARAKPPPELSLADPSSRKVRQSLTNDLRVSPHGPGSSRRHNRAAVAQEADVYANCCGRAH